MKLKFILGLVLFFGLGISELMAATPWNLFGSGSVGDGASFSDTSPFHGPMPHSGITVNNLCTSNTFNNSAYSINVNYFITNGGWAGCTYGRLNGTYMLDLSANFAAGDSLCLVAKKSVSNGTLSMNFKVTNCNNPLTGAWRGVTLPALTSEYKLYTFPLSMFTNSNIRGSQMNKIGQLSIGCVAGWPFSVPKGVYIDEIWIMQRPTDTNRPSKPTLVSPANGAAASASVSLIWNKATDVTGVSNYTVEISPNSSFSTIERSVTLTTTNYAPTGLGQTIWYWRVRAKDKVLIYPNTSSNSLIRSFNLDMTGPTISSRSPSSNVFFGFLNVPFSWTLTDPSVVQSNWLQIDNNRDGIVDSSVGFGTTTGNTYAFTAQGTNNWRIKARDTVGNVSSNSWFPIIIDTNLPLASLVQPLNGALQSVANVDFKWQVKFSVTNWLVYSADNFITPTTVVLAGIATNYSTSLPSGIYKWYVKTKKNSFTMNSITNNFIIDTAAPSAPGLLSPVNNAVTSTNTNISFSWSAVSGGFSSVSAYTLQISTNIGFAGQVFKTNCITTSLVKHYGAPHLYFWKVMARKITGIDGPYCVARKIFVGISQVLNISVDNQITSGNVTLDIPANALPENVGNIEIAELLPADGVMGKGSMADETPSAYFTLALLDNPNLNPIDNFVVLNKDGMISVNTALAGALYYFDGVQWVKIGGIYENGKVTAPLSVVGGKYAVFTQNPATAAKLNFVGAAAQFTPNGDGINDLLPFYFDNPKGEKVSLKILNLRGKLIRSMDTLNSGTGWNGKDDDGKIPSSGPYLYQLKIGNKVFSGTFVLLK